MAQTKATPKTADTKGTKGKRFFDPKSMAKSSVRSAASKIKAAALKCGGPVKNRG